MNRKKMGLAAIASVVAMSFVAAACSKQTDSNNSQSANNQPADDANKVVELKVASQPKYAPNKIPNMYITEVEKRFNMKWTFEAIPGSAGMDKFNVMFASGDYPDFIQTINSFNDVKKWASAGYLLPISDYLDKIPNYRKLFSDKDWTMLQDFANINGKLYTLPSVAANDPMSFIYRKDAFDKAGITTFPKTTAELYEALKKLKADYPESVGIGVRGGSGITGIKGLMEGFTQVFRYPVQGFWQDPDASNQVVYSMASTKHRDMLIYLAKLYKEGLIDKEFATLSLDQWKEKRLTGKILIDFQWASHTVDPLYELKNIPGGKWEYARYFPQAYDKPALQYSMANYSLFGPVFSSKLAKEPAKLDRVLEYINWAATEEGQLFHMMGLENVSYVKENGSIKYKDGYDRKKVAEEYGFDWLLKQSEEVTKTDKLAAKKAEALKEMADVFNATAKSANLTEEDSQIVNKMTSSLSDVAYQFATKAVMGAVDVTKDDVWNAYLKDLDKVGLQSVLDVYKKYWK